MRNVTRFLFASLGECVALPALGAVEGEERETQELSRGLTP
jgi:hypothetical protein